MTNNGYNYTICKGCDGTFVDMHHAKRKLMLSCHTPGTHTQPKQTQRSNAHKHSVATLTNKFVYNTEFNQAMVTARNTLLK